MTRLEAETVKAKIEKDNPHYIANIVRKVADSRDGFAVEIVTFRVIYTD